LFDSHFAAANDQFTKGASRKILVFFPGIPLDPARAGTTINKT